VSGNVSLYNETGGRPIHPTPVVGCVGLVRDVRRVPGTWREGDAIYLAGAPELTLDGSEYQTRYGELAGRPGGLDLAAEARLIAFLHEVAPAASLVHDAAEGGLAICLAEAATVSGIGADVQLGDDAVTLFGEGGGQAIVACEPAREPDIVALRDLFGVPVRRIGTVGGRALLGVPVARLAEVRAT